jgi:hypothetical protein
MHTALFVLLLSILTLGVLGGPVPVSLDRPCYGERSLMLLSQEWTGAPSVSLLAPVALTTLIESDENQRTQDQSTKRDEFGGRLAAPGWVPPPPSRDVEAKVGVSTRPIFIFRRLIFPQANLDDELPIEKRIVSGLVIRDSPLNGRGEQV